MSKLSRELIACPKCKEKSEVTMWESINTVISPEVVKQVHDHTAFRFVCPHCGFEADLNYSLLYHMMDKKVMIFYATSEEDAESFARSIFSCIDVEDFTMRDLYEKYTIRIVSSKIELYEKIAIFEAGLDDRTLEIYKNEALQIANEKIPNLNADAALLESCIGDDVTFKLFSKGEDIASIDSSLEVLSDFEDRYSDLYPTEPLDNLYVDSIWAKVLLDEE